MLANKSLRFDEFTFTSVFFSAIYSTALSVDLCVGPACSRMHNIAKTGAINFQLNSRHVETSEHRVRATPSLQAESRNGKYVSSVPNDGYFTTSKCEQYIYAQPRSAILGWPICTKSEQSLIKYSIDLSFNSTICCLR